MTSPGIPGGWNAKLGTIPIRIISGPDAVDDPTADFALRGEWVTQDATKTLTSRDVPADQKVFNRGCGVLVRKGPEHDGMLAWTESGFSHLDGLTPSGLLTGRGSGIHSNLNVGGSTAVGTPIIDDRLFAGDRWCITAGGRVIRFPSGDPTVAQVPNYSPALNAYGDPNASLRTGYECTAIEVWETSTGVPCLLVFAYNNSVPASRVYMYTQASGWSESALAFTGIKITKAVAPVWWQAQASGTGAQRLLVAVTRLPGGVAPTTTNLVANEVWQLVRGSDPTLEASYVTPIVTDVAADIQKLLAFPEFAFAVTRNGLWTFNEQRAFNLTPYAALGASYTDGRVATLYQGGVFWGRGFSADYYEASVAFRRQDKPTPVGHSDFFQDNIPVRGQLVAAVPYEQWLIQAIYDHESNVTWVGRSAPRDLVNVDGPGPWVQHWAEQVIRPTAGVGQQITHMNVWSPAVTTGTLIPNRTVYLVMFTTNEPFTAGVSPFTLYHAPLPTGQGPLAVQAAAGSFAYNSPARFVLSGQDHDDPLATKYIRRIDLLGRNLTSNQPIGVYYRTSGSDAAAMADLGSTLPGPASWPLIQSVSGTNDAASITPSSEISGKRLWLQLYLSSNSSTAAAVCDAVSIRSKVAREVLPYYTMTVAVGPGETLVGTPELRDPPTVADAIMALQNQGRQTLELHDLDASWSIYVEQGITFGQRRVGDHQYEHTITIPFSKVA